MCFFFFFFWQELLFSVPFSFPQSPMSAISSCTTRGLFVFFFCFKNQECIPLVSNLVKNNRHTALVQQHRSLSGPVSFQKPSSGVGWEMGAVRGQSKESGWMFCDYCRCFWTCCNNTREKGNCCCGAAVLVQP